MSAKIVSQRKWAKLVSSTGPLAQPPGAIPRMSNLLYTQRGSLQIADGSASIATIPGGFPLIALAPFTNLVPGQFPYYPALAYSPIPGLTDVTSLGAVFNAGAGNAAGPWTFMIVATNAVGHSALAIFYTVAAFNFAGVTFSWGAVPGATGYSIFVRTPPPHLGVIGIFGALLSAVGAVTTYTFTGTLPTGFGSGTSMAPFLTNNTYSAQLYIGSVISGALTFTPVTANGLFPYTLPQPASLAPGAPNFNYNPAIPSSSPYGGIAGQIDDIPQIVQFANLSVLILGNGYAPQAFDPSLGPGATVAALANTFTAAFPTWQASVDWITGAQVTDGAGNYYTATQGGVSQTPGPPTWHTALGAETADGSVVWTSQGPIVASTAPRGAAHAVAYAGSLWLANTSPTNTSDGIDGPSCLKMSDSNNPNSWNPVNTAFIGRSDGTQITGLQPFTIAALGISPTGSLCVFKEFQTYQVIGVFGSASFQIQPAQTNLGCLAARSIQFLPGFGVVRWTHLGFAVFDGINDRLISEDIRPYLFGGVDSESDLVPVDPQYLYLSQSAQTITPPMYLCAMPLTGGTGMVTRLFCYDLVMKAWTVIDLPWGITTLANASVGEGYPLVLAGKSDGTIQRMQSGDLNWDTGAIDQTAVQWSFRTPDLFGEGGTQRMFFEQATITGYGSPADRKSVV